MIEIDGLLTFHAWDLQMAADEENNMIKSPRHADIIKLLWREAIQKY